MWTRKIFRKICVQANSVPFHSLALRIQMAGRNGGFSPSHGGVPWWSGKSGLGVSFPGCFAHCNQTSPNRWVPPTPTPYPLPGGSHMSCGQGKYFTKYASKQTRTQDLLHPDHPPFPTTTPPNHLCQVMLSVHYMPNRICWA
jgi:hypothetical protein